MYRPKESSQMTTPMNLRAPTVTQSYGVSTKTWSSLGTILCNFKTYGGTETVNNGILSIDDTASIVTWYRPDIKSGCSLERISDGAVFEIIGEPENIELRNQFLKFKVRRIKGGA